MKYTIVFCLLFFTGCFLHAQKDFNEHVFVHSDKDCYVVGEEIWVKFLVVDNEFNSSTFSKIGYIEISDTNKPHVQLSVALENGIGAGKVKIPVTVPSGVYQLSAYTRYMCNAVDAVSFKKEIAIINMARSSEEDRIELRDDEVAFFNNYQENKNIHVSTDKNIYQCRDQVEVNLSNLPDNLLDMTISVRRNDSITHIQNIDRRQWLNNTGKKYTVSEPWEWLPEYEGHIIRGKVRFKNEAEHQEDQNVFSAGIGFVGNDIRYINGQQRENGLYYFYTGDIYGPQEIVTSVASKQGVPYQIDILSPYAEILPSSLPNLILMTEDSRLMDRFLGVQLQEVVSVDSLNQTIPLQDYYYFSEPVTYDLDQYTRFNTVGETIIEFVTELVVRRSDAKKRVIKVLVPDENRFSGGNTLVLLDGVPIRDHEDLLAYNPRNIRKIHIYNGKYLFGGEFFECLVSFVTHRENLSSILLSEGSQLVSYSCPSLPVLFDAPQYPDENKRKSLIPDFRHTLYWNPFAEKVNKEKTNYSFYTSDLKGEFEVVVEGFTKNGNLIYGRSTFIVD
ncbi:MAG: hypothetical protein LUH22_16600 [Bacteroides sp.]|nr:hypothetical protein [Bacteroides sp.]